MTDVPHDDAVHVECVCSPNSGSLCCGVWMTKIIYIYIYYLREVRTCGDCPFEIVNVNVQQT